MNNFFFSSLSNNNVVTPTALLFTNVASYNSSTCSYDLNSVGTVAPNTCVSTTYCWSLSKSAGLTSSASVSIYCNGVSIKSCSINGNSSYTCGGTFTAFIQKDNDSICLCTVAIDSKCIGANALICLCSIQQCVGCYCIGSPSRVYSSVGAV